MKTTTNILFLVLTMLVFFSGLHPASAFYNPGTQRWLNRDPVSEIGFYHAVRPDHTRINFRAKDYRFVANDPIDWGDYRGLYAVCCRGINAEAGDPLSTRLFGGLFKHCEIDETCPKDYESYPMEKDPNCNKCPAPDPDQCLKENPYSAGSGSWGDNCQANTLDRLKKCCLKAPKWSPNFYAYPPPQGQPGFPGVYP
jgi:hypothetical protein